MSDLRRAIESVFHSHRASLVWRLFKMVSCKATAEDIAQDAYVRMVSASNRQPVQHLPAFLFQTAHNLAIDHLRHRRRGERIIDPCPSPDHLDSIASTEASPETTAANRQAVEKLTKALDALPERTRQVLLLNRLEGMSYPEIADHLGVSQSTVYKDMQLALSHCMGAVKDR